MKTKILSIATVLFLTISITSCKEEEEECQTCNATDNTTGVVLLEDEVCGTQADFDAQSSGYQTIYGADPNVTVTCQ